MIEHNADEVDGVRITLPADFKERCAKVNQTIESGQAITFQQIADALGLPFEFVAASCAIAVALKSGRKVIVDPSAVEKPN